MKLTQLLMAGRILIYQILLEDLVPVLQQLNH